jgi:hypothetical protein
VEVSYAPCNPQERGDALDILAGILWMLISAESLRNTESQSDVQSMINVSITEGELKTLTFINFQGEV